MQKQAIHISIQYTYIVYSILLILPCNVTVRNCTFAQAFKGTVSQKLMCIFVSLINGYIQQGNIYKNSLRLCTPRVFKPQRVLLKLKIEICRFDSNDKKTGGRKSCWTVPLKWQCYDIFGFFHESNPPGPVINRQNGFNDKFVFTKIFDSAQCQSMQSPTPCSVSQRGVTYFANISTVRTRIFQLNNLACYSMWVCFMKKMLKNLVTL